MVNKSLYIDCENILVKIYQKIGNADPQNASAGRWIGWMIDLGLK
jgi:hypothetical protein